MYYFLNKEQYCQICTFPVWFDFIVMMSHLNMPYEKMADFVSFGFTLVIKLRNFDFESHLKYLDFLIKKWCEIWICPIKQCLIWFKLCCLRKCFGNNWNSWNSYWNNFGFSIKKSLFISNFAQVFCLFVLFVITIEIVSN